MKKILLAVFTAVSCLFIAAVALCSEALSAPVFALTEPLCVVLDAGHGGIDGGVVGKQTGVKESDLNLSITMKLAAIFKDAGFETVLTRKTEAGLYGAATQGFKKRDMQKRKEIIEGAKPALMISVHQNFYPTGLSRGGQVFYRAGSESGKMLAEEIQNTFNTLYASVGVKARNAMTGDYFMLNCTEYPSVIAECGFLSSSDEALLVSDEFQSKLAKAIFAGALKYLERISAAVGA